MNNILTTIIWNNSLLDWLISIGILLATYLVLKLVVGVLHRKLAKKADQTQNRLDDLITQLLGNIKSYFLLVVSIYAGTLHLTLEEGTSGTLRLVILIVILLQVGVLSTKLITYFISSKMTKPDEETDLDKTTLSVVGFIAKLVVWTVILLLILDNLPGVEVTTLITGLGIGGIAIGLAVQNVLGDLFASLSIALDRPFVIGDYIVVGDMNGTVEKIGLKSTRVRSLTGELLVFGNSDLLGSRIRNFKQMQRRRVVFQIGVLYETPYDKLTRIPHMIEEIITQQSHLTFDRVHFKEFGDFSLIYEIVYHLETSDYTEYMDAQQIINLAIFKRFEEEGIGFAYPTQTLYLSNN